MTQVAPCGTLAAYRRHLRHGEPTCEPCREANRRHRREHEQRKRANRATARTSSETTPDVRGAQGAADRPTPRLASIEPDAVDTVHPIRPPDSPSAFADLTMARDALVSGIVHYAEHDPSKLGPLVRELREVRKHLDGLNTQPAAEDEFTAARRRRGLGEV